MSVSESNEVLPRLTWRDALAYLLAYALWAAISAGAGVLMLLLRSAITPPLAILLMRNPYYLQHSVELRGMVNSLDRTALIVLAIIWVVYILWLEEWCRGAIKLARERRLRAALSDVGRPATETALQRWSLDLLPRRVGMALLLPAALIVLYLVLQGVFWLLTR